VHDDLALRAEPVAAPGDRVRGNEGQRRATAARQLDVEERIERERVSAGGERCRRRERGGRRERCRNGRRNRDQTPTFVRMRPPTSYVS